MIQHHAEYSQANSMSKHLYPLLATFAVFYGAIQIAPIAQQARDMNVCVKHNANSGLVRDPEPLAIHRAVLKCNGGSW